MTIQQQQEHDFDAYYEYLRSKQINIAPDLGVTATNALLSPIALGVVEASAPNKLMKSEYATIPSEVESRDVGAVALASVSRIEDYASRRRPALNKIAENSLNSVA